MSKERFIGHRKEIEDLNDLFNKKSASLVAILGRRRVGKSRLIKEFDNIFADLFPSRSMFYKKIVEYLSEGLKELNDMANDLDLFKNGNLVEYMEILVGTRYAEGLYLEHKPIEGLRVLTILGSFILEKLCIYGEDKGSDNPFFQRKTIRQSGCQIDYMIQTKFNTLYACEIKFSKSSIGIGIIDEVKEKLTCLSIPRGFSVVPVLTHANGVDETVIDKEYFKSIIDFGEATEGKWKYAGIFQML